MTRLPFAGVTINVERWGEGPPIILLHGFTGSAEMWAPFAPRLRNSNLAKSIINNVGDNHLLHDSPADEMPSASGSTGSTGVMPTQQSHQFRNVLDETAESGSTGVSPTSVESGSTEVSPTHQPHRERLPAPSTIQTHRIVSHQPPVPRTTILGERYQLIAIDLLGHGQSDSPGDPNRYRVERCVADVLAVADHFDLAYFDLVGYSMGGRVALNLAISAPERVRALALESASPGIESLAERRARVESDSRLADLLEREGTEAFVDRWETVPLFASQARLPSATRERLRRQRLRNNPTGLANSLRGLGAGVPEPLVDRLEEIAVPTLLVVGELDSKYRDFGRLMSQSMQSATLAVVPDTGHAVHLEQPIAFAQLLTRFLNSIPR